MTLQWLFGNAEDKRKTIQTVLKDKTESRQTHFKYQPYYFTLSKCTGLAEQQLVHLMIKYKIRRLLSNK